MPSNTEIADVLDKAADLYESETIDWCTHHNFGPGRRAGLSACAQGAIFLASGLVEVKGRGVIYAYTDDIYAHNVATATLYALTDSLNAEKLLRALGSEYEGETIPPGSNWVPAFNDAVAKSKQEVIDAMKNCAKGLRNGA